jgi:hypothetical protein
MSTKDSKTKQPCTLHSVNGCRFLHLSLKKEPFAVMFTGEKQEEFRKNSDWIRSRLFDKEDNEREYDYIKFVNGYGADKPYFICKYEGFMECYMDVAERKYSNGLSITGIGKGDFIIYCGDVVERGNLGCR